MEKKQPSTLKIVLLVLVYLFPLIGGLVYIFVECLHKDGQAKKRKNETFVAAIGILWVFFVPAIILTLNTLGVIQLDKTRMKEDNLVTGHELGI